jgi:hypothetical protein
MGAGMAAMATLAAGEKKREDIGNKPGQQLYKPKVLMFFFYLL